MSFLRRTLTGVVGGSVRAAGRFASSHVLPDTLVPSWKTQRRISKLVSSTSRTFSQSAKKPKQKAPSKLRQYLSSAIQQDYQHLKRVLNQAPRSGSVRSTATVRPPRPASAPSRTEIEMRPARAKLMAGPPSVRNRRPAPVVRPQIANEARFDSNGWKRGATLRASSDWEMIPKPRPAKVFRDMASRTNRATTTKGKFARREYVKHKNEMRLDKQTLSLNTAASLRAAHEYNEHRREMNWLKNNPLSPYRA